jgi:hypothetical protein
LKLALINKFFIAGRKQLLESLLIKNLYISNIFTKIKEFSSIEPKFYKMGLKMGYSENALIGFM